VRKAKITHHRIGFPEYEIAFHQRRHAPVGIHREIGGFVVLAEGHAGIDTVIGEIEFTQAPQHLLNIDRIGPAPDGELFLVVVVHAFSPDDLLVAVHSGISAKKRGLESTQAQQKNPAPPTNDGAGFHARRVWQLISDRRTTTAI